MLNNFLESGPILQKGIRTEVIIVTDDNGQGKGNLADDFVNHYNGKPIRVHAIVGYVKSATNGRCHIRATGEEYKKVAEQTGGLVLNICAEDWNDLNTYFRASQKLY